MARNPNFIFNGRGRLQTSSQIARGQEIYAQVALSPRLARITPSQVDPNDARPYSARSIYGFNTTLICCWLGGGISPCWCFINIYSQHASASFVTSFQPDTQYQICQLYARALRLVFLLLAVFAAVGCLLAAVEKEVMLPQDLNTEFGMSERRKVSDNGDSETREIGCEEKDRQ